MANNNGDWLSNLSANTISAQSLYYDSAITSVAYNNEGTIDDVSGRQMLETIQQGVYKTLVSRRDEAKAIWEEEDDDASYGEYKALKDTVELLDQFLRQAPTARYSGLQRSSRRDYYGRY